MLKSLKHAALVLFWSLATLTVTAQAVDPAKNVLILYDGSGAFGWYGNLHAKLLANLMGHFDLSYQIKAVENYQPGDVNTARTTFYLGLSYDNPLPAAFTNDVTTTTNTVCWFKYNMWQVGGNVFFPNEIDSRIGFRVVFLDQSGYTNIVYKGASLKKNPLDPELGLVEFVNPNIASAPAVAWRTNADNSTASTAYIAHGSNFWYVADSPFDYISEEDRYLAFCDLLHDILGINHAESHQAIIRFEDVSTGIYSPEELHTVANYCRTNGKLPFVMATIPVYTDPLGYYNSGIPENHRISDNADPDSVAFLAQLKYAVTNGGQILIHGYTHQYDTTNNPFEGTTADDFEFWRETFGTDTNAPGYPFATELYEPVPEDSVAWVSNRLKAATNELTKAGLPWVGWETPHYTASETDYRVMATNFDLTMQRVIYFADDYTPANRHLVGQFFPYTIARDVYGQKVVPENLGNFEPDVFYDFPTRSVEDVVRAAKKNLVIRDGWANAYFHGFYDVTNLAAMVSGIQDLGYTYVPLKPSGPPVITFQPRSQTNLAQGTAGILSVAAIGPAPLQYQWLFNAIPLAAATNALLAFAPLLTNNSGDYTVIITNAFGAVTSAIATLTVNYRPTITGQPASRTNLAGTTASFTVVATGIPAPSYQWRFNSNNIADATADTLTLTHVLPAQAGSYSVLVSNVAGTIISSNATLVVTATAPVLQIGPGSQANTFSLLFTTITGFNYYVERKDALPDASWLPLTNLLGAGGPTNVDVSGAAAQRFFHLRVQ